jgi:hypothetical protein
MKTEVKEHLELIATRVPPGDRWTLVGDSVVHKSITDAMQYFFDKNGEYVEFRLAPLYIKLYVIRNKEVEIKPPPVKSYSLYGDRD